MPTMIATTMLIDVDLLREQRNALLRLNSDSEPGPTPTVEEIDGLIEFCDYVLDVAEGHRA